MHAKHRKGASERACLLNFYHGQHGERQDGKEIIARENLKKVYTLLRRRRITPPRGYTESISLLAKAIAERIRNAKF